MGNIFGVSLALLAGYVFVHTSYFRRFSYAHMRTDRFALHLLGFSFVLYLAGAISSELIPDWTPDRLDQLRDDALSVGVGPALVNALVIAAVYGLYENFKLARRLERNSSLGDGLPSSLRGRMRMAALVRFVKKSSDATLRLLFRAVLLNKLVQVTMKSGKVYVGRLRWPEFDPAQPLTTIHIIPFFSGYRDSTSKKLIVTTKYSDLFDDLEPLSQDQQPPPVSTNPLATDIWSLSRDGEEAAQIDIEDLGVVIALAEVASLSLYDDAIYKWFQDQTPHNSSPPV